MKNLLLLILLIGLIPNAVFAQRNFGIPENQPAKATTVVIPSVSLNNGPGDWYDSSTGLWPGLGMDYYNYVADEYVISGTADGEPYKTRMVIRRPEDMSRFTGLIVAEPMHPAGFAHGFEHNSIYIMDEGHIAVEITTMGLDLAKQDNPARYQDHQFANHQTSEVLAQAGALLKSEQSPIAGQGLRKIVLWGTSASSRIVTNYLSAHQVFKRANGENIYDGFMPTSNGTRILPVDVPMIQMPTQHEYMNVATAVQDGDAPGEQFRVYEFAGIGHLMARHNPRMTPQLCENKPTEYPLEVFFPVSLHHMFQWLDKGIAPPNADRVLLDRNINNDDSLMVLDEHGNPVGGIRNAYVDIPFAQYIAGNTIAAGQDSAMSVVCRLSVYEVPFSKAKLRNLYGNKTTFLRQFEDNLNQHEAAGWSLPVFHDLIMADAKAVEF